MDIPALSMALSQNNILNSVGIAMLDKSLELNQDLGAQLTAAIDHSMELSVNPYVGANFDMSV